MVMKRSDFRKELQEGLNAVFGLSYKRYPEQWKKIFDVETSRKAFEEDVLSVGLGAAPVKAEGGGVSYDVGFDSYVARYQHETIALAFAITEEAIEDGLYGDLGKRYSKALARSMQHTKEVKGANIFNNGFSSSYPGGDGVELFATNHPLGGGGTQQNELSTPSDLSEAALEEALIIIQDWTDDRGIPVAASAQRLIVPTELQFIAERILMSEFRPGTGDNDVNAMKAMGSFPGGFSVNVRLTDADAWFIKTDINEGLKHIVRKRVSGGVEGDFESGNMRYKKRERYSFGWSDWRGAFASAGA